MGTGTQQNAQKTVVAMLCQISAMMSQCDDVAHDVTAVVSMHF
jgi:hypothetical protein